MDEATVSRFLQQAQKIGDLTRDLAAALADVAWCREEIRRLEEKVDLLEQQLVEKKRGRKRKGAMRVEKRIRIADETG